MENNELTLLHRQALSDENLTVEQIAATPDNADAAALAETINELEGMVTNYQALTDADEKEKKKIEGLSAKLAHKIKDFAEASLPDDDVNKDNPPPPPPPIEQTPPVAAQQTPPAAPLQELEAEAGYLERRRRRFEDDGA